MIFALAFFAAIPISGFISVAFLIYREKQGWGWLLFAVIIIAGSIHMKTGINHERTRNVFNAEMVRAILDGRKTQTRRIMKVRRPKVRTDEYGAETDYEAHWYTPGVVVQDGYLQPAKHDVFV
jgi:hypothetical protein